MVVLGSHEEERVGTIHACGPATLHGILVSAEDRRLAERKHGQAPALQVHELDGAIGTRCCRIARPLSNRERRPPLSDAAHDDLQMHGVLLSFRLILLHLQRALLVKSQLPLSVSLIEVHRATSNAVIALRARTFSSRLIDE